MNRVKTILVAAFAATIMTACGGDGEQPAAAAEPPEEAPRSAEETWLIATLARLTRARPELLRASDRLADLGVDSLTRVELIGAIEARLGRRLDDTTAAALGRVQDLYDLCGDRSLREARRHPPHREPVRP